MTRALKTDSEHVIRKLAIPMPTVELRHVERHDRLYINFQYVLADETGEIHPPKDGERIEIGLSPDLEAKIRAQLLLDLNEMGEQGLPLSPAFWRQLHQEDQAVKTEAMLANLSHQEVTAAHFYPEWCSRIYKEAPPPRRPRHARPDEDGKDAARRSCAWLGGGCCAPLLSLALAFYISLHGTAALRLDLLRLSDRAGAAYRARPRPALAVAASLAASRAATLGPWRVGWDGTARQLSVGRSAGGSEAEVIWRSRAGDAFVAAGVSESVAAEAHGNFQIRERLLWQCIEQQVESWHAEADEVELRGGFLDDARCREVEWRLVFSMADHPEHMSFTLNVSSTHTHTRMNRAQLVSHLDNATAVWGLGVQFRHFNLRGHCVPAFISEQGIGRGAAETQPISTVLNALGCGAGGNDYTTYSSSAGVITSSGGGLLLENSELSHWDLGSGGCSDKRSLVWEGLPFGSFGLSTNSLTVSVHSHEMRGRMLAPAPCVGCDEAASDGFVASSRHLALIESLTAYTGRMQPLPQWADGGLIVGLQGGTGVVERKLGVIKAAGLPVAAVWLQDWVGKRYTPAGDRLWWNWVRDEQTYPQWDEMRQRIAPVRVLTYVNSMLSDPTEKEVEDNTDMDLIRTLVAAVWANMPPALVPRKKVAKKRVLERWKRNLFDEALKAGYFVSPSARANASLWASPTDDPTANAHMVEVAGYWAALIDLTNPAAREWIKRVLRAEMIAKGSSGWMADFGEALPCDGVRLHDGSPPCTYHSLYAYEWAKLNHEAIEDATRAGEVLIFSRSGFTQSPGVAQLFWLGDQLTSWDEYDGIGSALQGALGGGMSGFSLTHSDIGGYTGANVKLFGKSIVRAVRDRELLLRWAELSAFSDAVLRTHEGLLPFDNHQESAVWSDNVTLQHFDRCLRIFLAFRPYRRALMAESGARGWPLVRHPVLHFPNDPVLLADRGRKEGGVGRIRQFMLGPDYMVIPLLRPNRERIRGYLPRGRWIRLWENPGTNPTLEISKGRWSVFDAPLGRPAVFARADAPSLESVMAALGDAGVL
ncbi:hypothetical protein AB1Y20_014952 [Prymnesium parvum]|uniref:Alpha-glucosidase n=1 Tax=Prymnesium parvum TaxID=97485 RepID=A0AB34JYZ5_PRYPA